MSASEPSIDPNAIAVIGMAGRLPGADSLASFWKNLCDGAEAISFFSEAELAASGIPQEVLSNPDYVKASSVLEDIELFDAAFFGYSPREAAETDPQHRLFLECSWEALEDAGYDPGRFDGRIGVFASASPCSYRAGETAAAILRGTEEADWIARERDFLPTRVSYKLDLRGPSVNVQTACSSSLVAVHHACQSILSDECDMALAGGASVRIPQVAGYLYSDGGILSPDGHCRSFDADARGTVRGNGVGVVALKRLEQALADGDSVYAVIRGSAINNDGSRKVGYTAPSVEAQSEVVSEALAVADVAPDTIGYVEAHGTGTALGDPIEVEALNQVFAGVEPRSVPLGALKSNIGHLDAASGIAGLIKTVLAVRHGTVPPSPNFREPNPEIDFAGGPFYVNTEPAAWKPGVRRAGLSSFGIGGTNAHVVLEEAPPARSGEDGRPEKLLVLSARSEAALEQASDRLAAHLRQQPDGDLADAAYTAQVGRRAFGHRRILVCGDREDALGALESRDPERLLSATADGTERTVAFLCSGLGEQYVGMGYGLYETEPAFREALDECCERLRPHLETDLREVLYPGAEAMGRTSAGHCLTGGDPAADSEEAQRLERTRYADPAHFAVGYAVAKLWMAWGVTPERMLGYGVGEYVAACLAGVLSLEDALFLVAKRAQLVEEQGEGAMLGVDLPERVVAPLVSADLALAAENSESLRVLSGRVDAVQRVQDELTARGVPCRRLPVRHAFHSPLLEPAREAFTRCVEQVSLHPPEIPFVSSVTGSRITAAQATSPEYWADHLCKPVRFRDGLRELHDDRRVLLEVGPGQTLCTFARQDDGDVRGSAAALPSLRHGYDGQSDARFLQGTLGRLWLAGVKIDWEGVHAGRERRRVPLPTYPFERRRCWIDSTPDPSDRSWEVTLGDSTILRSVSWHPRPDLPTPYVAPRSELEQLLAEHFQNTLGVEQVGIHDSFFELGGHSLQAVQLVSKVRAELHAAAPLDEFLEHPTVERLARIVSETPESAIEEDLAEALEAVESLSPEEARAELAGVASPAPRTDTGRSMDFSLFFFSGDESDYGDDKYRLVTEAARFADRAGFEAIWTPERHFHSFGGLYPNPSVLAAALAATTERIQIRGGSVILPLHDPLRVVEEWSVVDNLSRGRAGFAVAAGFHPQDFVLRPEVFADRRANAMELVETVQRIWRGEPQRRRNGAGVEVEVTCHPRPVQPELPIWLTTGSTPEVFVEAGRLGVNVLTALLQLSVEQLAEHVATYRKSLADHGHDPRSGRVTIMLHTFVGDDLAEVRETVREPFYSYLRNHSELLRSLTSSIEMGIDWDDLTEADREALFELGFKRYFDHSSLMGTVESCSDMVSRLGDIGVDEIACLIDFGMDVPTTMWGLERLKSLMEQVQAASSDRPSTA